MKKTCCILLIALLMLLCGTAMAECADGCDFEWAYDAENCWLECTNCGAINGEKGSHMLSCVEIGTCRWCKATGLSGDPSHWIAGEINYDENECWYICDDCGQEDSREAHSSYCDSENPGKCYRCGQPCEISHMMEQISYIPGNCVVGATVELKCEYCGEEETVVEESDGECWYEWVNQGDKHAYMCAGCGTVEWTENHYLPCTGGSTCAACGASGVTGDVSHNATGDWQHDDTKCWLDCGDCDEKAFENPHWNFCESKDVCINCGSTGVSIQVEHTVTENSAIGYDATECWYICDECGAEAGKTPHQYGEDDKCTYCGQLKVTGEHEHVWEVTDTVYSTCTEAGKETSTCTLCGETSERVVRAPGHYWIYTMVTKEPTCTEAGYHKYKCRDCGKKKTTELPAIGHTMVETETGSACSVCGYAEEAAVAPVETGIAATVEGENLSADVTLVVDQPQEDVSALLPEDIRASVQQVYVVKLLEKGEAIEPNGSIKIAIELEEGADLTGKQLMLLQEDGTLVEIAYEVVEGKLTFVTEAIGTFVLVDAPAE